MTLIKTVKKDGTGDYISLSGAFNDMLASGLAASGDILEYYIMVDEGVYYEHLNGYIPYSGIFNIISSGAVLHLTDSNNITGERPSFLVPCLQIYNMTLIASGISDNIFTIAPDFGIGINNTQILCDNYGIQNSGGLCYIKNSSSCAEIENQGYFLKGEGTNIIENIQLSNYGTGFYVNNLFISNSTIHNNMVGVYTDGGSDINITSTLLYDNEISIIINSGILNISNSTIDGQSYIESVLLQCESSILTSNIIFSGIAESGSYIKNSCLYSKPILDSNIIETNNIYSDPKFNNTSLGDYRLKLEQTIGSPCIELEDDLNINDVSFEVTNTMLQLFDNFGQIKITEFLPYTYVQNSTIILSDYGKEYKFAHTLNDFKNITYILNVNCVFSEYNVQTKPSFTLDANQSDPYPWDWDYKSIHTTKICQDEKYIIPRSVINIEEIVFSKLKTLTNQISYKDITKNNIKVFDQVNYFGVAYDSNLSTSSESIIWIIDKNNQSLIKQNAFTGENLYNYPLLCPESNKKLVKPSGIIYIGVDGEHYKFIKTNNPSEEIKAYSENGECQWLSTNINTKFDVRGIVSDNDCLFITGSEYSTDISSNELIPTGQSIGRLLWYHNNDLFYNYMKIPESIGGPKICTLSSGNYYPTDLTIYEDGTILVADYFSLSGIYRYKKAYDYAMVQSFYDKETKILLREYYNDVNL